MSNLSRPIFFCGRFDFMVGLTLSFFPPIFQSDDCKILLQNENGPCPLLACANVLLLRGVISLPSVSVRNGAASLEEVLHMLAEKIMNYNNHQQEGSEDTSHHHHINEVLDLLPNLQYGMDINPRFNSPTGMEFTKELSTFDLLNVKMVHGWLLDPQSEEVASLVGTKTYNELIEIVIRGNDASAELHKMEEQLKKLEPFRDDDWIDVGVLADLYGKGEAEIKKPDQTRQTVGQLRVTLRKKQTDLSQEATVGSLINNFLQSTGHQLTQYGLQELHEHLAENELCVFFRNNHFSTLTKHEGYLYLLVTDLGYANVPNVVWERIDVIDGDTEYVDAGFSRPGPQADNTSSFQSPNLDPDQLLAQRGQTESDYQLALQLSGEAGKDGGQGAHRNISDNLDEHEGNLMAAATEASLRAYNGVKDEEPAPQQNYQHHDPDTTQEDRDHLLAMQLHADMENQDMRMAQQMQENEWAEQRNNNNGARANTTATTTEPTAKNSNCLIS